MSRLFCLVRQTVPTIARHASSSGVTGNVQDLEMNARHVSSAGAIGSVNVGDVNRSL